MKKMYNPFKVIIITVLLVLLYPAAFNAKAANYSSTLSDVVVEYYHPTVSFTITSHYQKARELWGKVAAHLAEDYAASVGTDVYAAADGVVQTVSSSSSAGNFIVIRHNDGSFTRYLHLQKALVEETDIVKVGDVIAKAGKTGKVTGPHLHFEIIKDGVKVNPSDYVTRIRANEVRVPTGCVRIKTTKDGSKVLRFDENNNLVVCNRAENDPYQLFALYLYNGKYMFKCIGNGKNIDVAGAGHECGTGVTAWSENKTIAQTFDIIYEPSADMYYIISDVSGAAGTDMILDVSSCDPTLDGSIVHLWSRIKDSVLINQVFDFEPVSLTNYTISFNVGEIGSIKKGKCKNLTGSVIADCDGDQIVELYACIKNLNGKVLYQSTDNVSVKSLNLKSSNANYKAASFNRLAKGNYYFVMTAKSQMGAYAEYVTMFTIK